MESDRSVTTQTRPSSWLGADVQRQASQATYSERSGEFDVLVNGLVVLFILDLLAALMQVMLHELWLSVLRQHLLQFLCSTKPYEDGWCQNEYRHP